MIRTQYILLTIGLECHIKHLCKQHELAITAKKEKHANSYNM